MIFSELLGQMKEKTIIQCLGRDDDRREGSMERMGSHAVFWDDTLFFWDDTLFTVSHRSEQLVTPLSSSYIFTPFHTTQECG